MLVDVQEDWRKYWTDAGMPDWLQTDCHPFQSLPVFFSSLQDREHFSTLLNTQLTGETSSIWFPPRVDRRWRKKEEAEPVEPGCYPVYIVSKGRWNSRLTARALDRLGLPYSIVVEPQELVAYAKNIDPKKILALPFSNLGQGSIPARNWIWDHAQKAGAERHWILDDNIRSFYEINQNQKQPIVDFNPFGPVEQFTQHYPNIGLSGMNYKFFVPDRTEMPAIYLNTRIYSCILIRNDLPFRWRGKYNEDTDLSLRVLKAGWPTVLFNYVATNKIVTMGMKGGNTDELYKGDGRLEMAKSLKAQHPELVTISRKWGRWQHHVDYRPFRKLKLLCR